MNGRSIGKVFINKDKEGREYPTIVLFNLFRISMYPNSFRKTERDPATNIVLSLVEEKPREPQQREIPSPKWEEPDF